MVGSRVPKPRNTQGLPMDRTDGDEAPVPRAISDRTGVTIGVLGMFAALSVSVLALGVVLLNAHFARLDESLETFDDRFSVFSRGLADVHDQLGEIGFSLRSIASDVGTIQSKSDGYVRLAEFEAWIQILRAQNPDSRIPDLKR